MESLAYILARQFSIRACPFWELGRYSLKPNKIQGLKKKAPIPSKPIERRSSSDHFLTGPSSIVGLVHRWSISGDEGCFSPTLTLQNHSAFPPMTGFHAIGSGWLRAAVASMFFFPGTRIIFLESLCGRWQIVLVFFQEIGFIPV